jgi:glutamyl-tRNA synthetase
MHEAGLEVAAADLMPVVPLIQERIKTLAEAVGWTDFFFQTDLDYDAEMLVGKKMDAEGSLAALEQARHRLAGLPDYEVATIDGALRGLATELGLKVGQLLGVIRVAVSGKKVAPPLFETLSILGRERTLERVDRGIGKLESLSR